MDDNPSEQRVWLTAWAIDGDPAGSVQELRRCLALARTGTSKEDVFHALHSLGYVLALMNRTREGESLLREALELAPQFVSKTGPTYGQCALELGQCLEREGRVTGALPWYRIAYENFRNAYGDIYATRRALATLQNADRKLSR